MTDIKTMKNILEGAGINTQPLSEDAIIQAYDEVCRVGFCTPTLSNSIASEPVLAEPEPIQQQILLSHGTKAVCTQCGREDAHFLYLKRYNGKYEMLCRMSDGSGCWPQSHRGLCSHQGPDMEQCLQLAEWKIVFGAGLRSIDSCTDHLGKLCGAMPVTEPREVYHLED